MNCPVCDAKLREVNKMNVQVDICPDCKGIWLDRGELEKLLEIAAQGGSQSAAPERSEPRREEYRSEERREYREHDDHDEKRRYEEHGHNERGGYDSHGRPRKKESFLTNIMDMFGGGED